MTLPDGFSQALSLLRTACVSDADGLLLRVFDQLVVFARQCRKGCALSAGLAADDQFSVGVALQNRTDTEDCAKHRLGAGDTSSAPSNAVGRE